MFELLSSYSQSRWGQGAVKLQKDKKKKVVHATSGLYSKYSEMCEGQETLFGSRSHNALYLYGIK